MRLDAALETRTAFQQNDQEVKIFRALLKPVHNLLRDSRLRIFQFSQKMLDKTQTTVKIRPSN